MKQLIIRHLSKLLPPLVFFILALVIVYPLLKPGFVLTLDMVPVPKNPFPDITNSFFLISILKYLAGLIIPLYWFEKIILFLVFFLGGLGVSLVVPVKNLTLRILAGIIFIINPFFYERVMAGQWYLLLAYSLFTFAVLATVRFFEKPNLLSTLYLGVITTLLFSIFFHFTLIFSVFFVIYTIIYLLSGKPNILLTIRYLSFFIFLMIVFNLNWLVPIFINKSPIIGNISSFDRGDLIAFQSVEDEHFGLVFNLLSGYGFWGEMQGYFPLPKDTVFFWPIVPIILILLSMAGIVKIFLEDNKKNLAQQLTIIVFFFICLDLAGGIALKPLSNAVFSLYENFPLMRGLREPQKLVGFLFFAYAYFSSLGFIYISKKIKPVVFYISIPIFIFLIFLTTPFMFDRFWWQLKPVFYPTGWRQANEILNKDSDNFLTVFFPWHQYMRYRFNNNLVMANPSSKYFDKEIIASRNYETAPLYTHDLRPESLHIEGLLRIQKMGKNLLGEMVEETPDWGESLSQINIKYIILVKEDDYSAYKFLDYQTGLKKEFEDDSLILYRNLAWVAGTDDMDLGEDFVATTSGEMGEEIAE